MPSFPHRSSRGAFKKIMQILIHLQARCCPLISSVQISVECKWAQISRNGGRRRKQIRLGYPFGSTTPTVKLMSICRETHCIWMMGEQLKEYFVTGLQPKGINSDFLSAAASRRAWLGRGRGMQPVLQAANRQGKGPSDHECESGQHKCS